MKENKIQKLPSLPGVYLFKHNDEIIYVGKAKDIKKRVVSYFANYQRDWKVNALVQEHTHIDHIVTHSETDALLLEAQLIRDNKPKFNVLLKSGQPFLYIFFNTYGFPTIELVRNKKRKGTYFGPFLQKRQARSAFHYVVDTFKLQRCKAKIEQGCLNYHLGKCAGTCMKNFDNEQYLFRLNLAKSLLQGHYKKSLKELREQIKLYTEQLAFEKAKYLHHYEQHLEAIFETLKARFSEKKYEKEVYLSTIPIYKKIVENPEITQELQQLLNLPIKPETIDCFDISHFQSSFIVGSCVRFRNGIPDKNSFRRFSIKTLEQQNDYAALQEIVSRRYKNPEDFPDLMLIDGGKGQLSAVAKLFPKHYIISLAKREETIFGKTLPPEGIILNQKTDAAQLLLALRDYAHHFAISYHRKKRHATF